MLIFLFWHWEVDYVEFSEAGPNEARWQPHQIVAATRNILRIKYSTYSAKYVAEVCS